MKEAQHPGMRNFISSLLGALSALVLFFGAGFFPPGDLDRGVWIDGREESRDRAGLLSGF